MFTIRNLAKNDYNKEYLDLLNSPKLSKNKFDSIIDNIENNPFHKIFVIYSYNEQKIIGTCTFYIIPRLSFNGCSKAYIEDFIFELKYEKFQKDLIQYCIKLSKDHNCNKIETSINNTLKNIFINLGFTTINNKLSLII